LIVEISSFRPASLLVSQMKIPFAREAPATVHIKETAALGSAFYRHGTKCHDQRHHFNVFHCQGTFFDCFLVVGVGAWFCAFRFLNLGAGAVVVYVV